MNNYIKLKEGDKIYPGDYVRYYDEWNEIKGSGILLKTVKNELKPLTESYYLFKNINNGKTWKIKCNRYVFYYKRNTGKESILFNSELIQSITNVKS
jgi:hypothetical protein